jgi:predicted Zn-dependent protease
MQQLQQQRLLITDPLLTDYIQRLGERLAPPGQTFRFFLIDRPDINAFAGPDGHIGIHVGLFLTSQTESELASVLAHEIAHVTQQHLLQAWEKTQNLTLPQAALTLATLIVGATTSHDAGLALAAGSQAALQQHQINFTRRHEHEADRIGIKLLAEANFDPHAMAAFFTRVSQANQLNNTQLPALLSTHPLNSQRTAEAQERAADYPYTQQQPDELGYYLARARLEHQQRPDNLTLAQRLANLQQGRYRNRLAAEYALVLALQDAQRWTEAASHLSHLLTQKPNTPEFILAQARYEARQQPTQALRRLRTALTHAPDNLALASAYAELAMAQGHYQAALTQLQTTQTHRPEAAQLYQLSARATAQLQQRGQTHRHLAEYHAAQGDLTAAIQHLQRALSQSDLTTAARIRTQTRLETLQIQSDQTTP